MRKIILIVGFFLLSLSIKLLTTKYIEGRESKEIILAKNSGMELPDDWFNNGFHVKCDDVIVFINTSQCFIYYIENKAEDYFGYYFDMAETGNDYLISHFYLKNQQIDSSFQEESVLELKLTSKINGEDFLFIQNINVLEDQLKKNRIEILNTSQKGKTFLSNSFEFHSQLNLTETGEIISRDTFTNIPYGDTDEYLDVYSYNNDIFDTSMKYQDNIINIIPENNFYYTGEKSFIGKEYGFYMNTVYSTDIISTVSFGRYVSTIYIFDIEMTQSSLHNDFNDRDSTSPPLSNKNMGVSLKIKPVCYGTYAAYSKPNVPNIAWTKLNLDPNQYNIVVPYGRFHQEYFLNVDDLAIYADNSVKDMEYLGESGFGMSALSYKLHLPGEKYESSTLKYATNFGVNGLISFIPGGNVLVELKELAKAIYEDYMHGKNIEGFPLNTFTMNKFDYFKELKDDGYPTFISIPQATDLSYGFFSGNIHTLNYYHEYGFDMENSHFFNTSSGTEYFNLYTYMKLGISINTPSASKTTFIEKSIDYGVQRYDQKSSIHTIQQGDLNFVSEITVPKTFQTAIFYVKTSGYYQVSLNSSNQGKIKGYELYNRFGNLISKVTSSGTTNGIFYLYSLDDSRFQYAEGKNLLGLCGQYFLKFFFDSNVTGDINVRVSNSNSNSINSLQQTFSFYLHGEVRYILFKPSTTAIYKIRTQSFLDPIITLFWSERSSDFEKNGDVNKDKSLINHPLFIQDNAYEYEPEEMMPDLNCNFEYELYKNNVYIFKLYNNSYYETGDLTFNIIKK